MFKLSYELGEPMNMTDYINWISYLEPTEFIVPDYKNDSEKTIEAAKEWSNFNFGPGMVKIGVVHGETYLDYCKCYLELTKTVDKIAFSFEDFFTKYIADPKDLAGARSTVLSMMIRDGIIEEELPHHILGCLHPNEYLWYVDLKWIESADTSNPVIEGIINGRYTIDRVTNYVKLPTLLADIVADKFHKKIEDDILYNIDWFRGQLMKKILLDPEREIVKNPDREIVKNPDRPSRYSSREVHGMDVIDLIKHWDLNFNEGNILKYLLRDKDEDVLDMEKIEIYAARELKHIRYEKETK